MAALADSYGHCGRLAMLGALHHHQTTRPTQGLIMSSKTATYLTAFEEIAMVLTVEFGDRE